MGPLPGGIKTHSPLVDIPAGDYVLGYMPLPVIGKGIESQYFHMNMILREKKELLGRLGGDRQVDKECRPFTRFAFQGDKAAVLLDDTQNR